MTLNSISEKDKETVQYLILGRSQSRLFLLVSSPLTSREEPVGVLDDGLDDADDLQGNRGHHLCDVTAADREQTGNFFMAGRGGKTSIWIVRIYTLAVINDIRDSLKGEN